MSNDFTHIPDQHIQIRGLFRLTVYAQFNCTLTYRTHLTTRYNWRQYGRLLEVFAEVPRTANFTCNQLQVAAGHVEATSVAINNIVSLLFSHHKAWLINSDNKLHLVVVVVTFEGIIDGAATRN